MSESHHPIHFTDQEISYLNAQRLGRLATISVDIRSPEDVPAAIELFRLNYERLKDIAARHTAPAG